MLSASCFWFEPQYLLWVFTTVVITIVAFPPPSLLVTRSVDLHASALSVVAVSSGIQVIVFVECIKMKRGKGESFVENDTQDLEI
jgi:hypothetical protein